MNQLERLVDLIIDRLPMHWEKRDATVTRELVAAIASGIIDHVDEEIERAKADLRREMR